MKVLLYDITGIQYTDSICMCLYYSTCKCIYHMPASMSPYLTWNPCCLTCLKETHDIHRLENTRCLQMAKCSLVVKRTEGDGVWRILSQLLVSICIYSTCNILKSMNIASIGDEGEATWFLLKTVSLSIVHCKYLLGHC